MILFMISFSLSAVWLKVISNSNLFVPAKIILNTLLLSHFLSNILKIFMGLLVFRRKSKGLSYLFDAFRKIILFKGESTILARAHPRAIQILELFLLKLLAVVKCSSASSGLCAFMNLSPSMKCLSAHCFSWSYRTLLHTRNQPLVVQPQRMERTKQTLRIQRIALVQPQVLAQQVSKPRIRKVLLILSQKVSREVPILLINLPIPRSNLHLIIADPRPKVPLELGLLIFEGQFVMFLHVR